MLNQNYRRSKNIYIICNLNKLKKDAVSPVERENERDEFYAGSNDCIDNSRTNLNYHIVNPPGNYLDVIENRIAGLNLKRKLRSDAVYLCSFVVTASPEFFKLTTEEQQYRFFRDCTNFFKANYGAENVLSAVVHKDETNPHMHLNLIPIVNGKLCAKDLFDQKLAILQTKIWKDVGEKYGLERGKEGNDVKHLSTAKFKAKKILDEANQKMQEATEYVETLKNAEESNLPWSKKGLKEQIVALSTENQQLKNNLDKVVEENFKMGKENDKLQEFKIEASKAVKILTDINEQNPELFNELIKRQQPQYKIVKTKGENWFSK